MPAGRPAGQDVDGAGGARRNIDGDGRADGVVPLRIVKVSVPSLTVPAVLVIVALSVTFWRYH